MTTIVQLPMIGPSERDISVEPKIRGSPKQGGNPDESPKAENHGETGTDFDGCCMLYQVKKRIPQDLQE